MHGQHDVDTDASSLTHRLFIFCSTCSSSLFDVHTTSLFRGSCTALRQSYRMGKRLCHRIEHQESQRHTAYQSLPVRCKEISSYTENIPELLPSASSTVVYVEYSRTGYTGCDTPHRTSIHILLFLLPLKRAGRASRVELPHEPYIHVGLECEVQEDCVLLDVELRLAAVLRRIAP